MITSIKLNNRFLLECAQKKKTVTPSWNYGAKVLDIIIESTDGVELYNSLSFTEDNLFCEFTYVINLDDEKLYCYEGGKVNKFYECSIHEIPSNEEFLNAYKVYSNEEDDD